MGNVRIVAFTWAESGDGERLSEADSWHSASDMKHWSLRPPCIGGPGTRSRSRERYSCSSFLTTPCSYSRRRRADVGVGSYYHLVGSPVAGQRAAPSS